VEQKDRILAYKRTTQRRLCFLINLLYFSVLIAIFFVAARYLFLWMLPFVMAFIVAAGLQRPISWLVKKTRVSKKVFSVIFVVLFVLFLASAVAIIGWQLILTIINFVKDNENIQMIEKYVHGLSESINEFVLSISNIISQDAAATLQDAVKSLSTNMISFVTGFFADIAASAATATTKLPMLLVSFIIWIIASIFLTIDYQSVKSFIMRQIPERHAETISIIKSLCTNTIFRIIRAYLLMMLITFAELSICFTVLRIPYAFLLAAIIALVDVLPVLGTGTILIPWAFLNLVMGNPKMFIGLGITYIIVTIVRNIVEPRLISQQIGLNPLITLFFMFLGLKAIGIFGMLLFPVIIMVIIQLQNSGRIKLWK
jgi:sporulation integral membrane protein YtvI